MFEFGRQQLNSFAVARNRTPLRGLPIGAEAARRVRVRIAGGGFQLWRWRFSRVRRPVHRRRPSSQKVLWPLGFPLFNRNAFRRRHSLGVVLREETVTRIPEKQETKQHVIEHRKH